MAVTGVSRRHFRLFPWAGVGIPVWSGDRRRKFAQLADRADHLRGGRSDVILVALAHKASDDKAALALNEIALRLCASRKRRSETCEQGQAFAKTRKDGRGHDMPEVVLPHLCRLRCPLRRFSLGRYHARLSAGLKSQFDLGGCAFGAARTNSRAASFRDAGT